MDGLASSGVVLPLLIFADLLAASTFRKDVQWNQIRRLALPIGVGLILGWLAMMALKDHRELFRPIVGSVVLGMLTLPLIRQKVTKLDAALPLSTTFA